MSYGHLCRTPAGYWFDPGLLRAARIPSDLYSAATEHHLEFLIATNSDLTAFHIGVWAFEGQHRTTICPLTCEYLHQDPVADLHRP